MLQEESVKRLSQLVHKAFSKAHINEFTTRLDVKVDSMQKEDKQLVSSVAETLQRNGASKERDHFNERLSQIETAPKQQPTNPNGHKFPQFSDHRPQNVPDNYVPPRPDLKGNLNKNQKMTKRESEDLLKQNTLGNAAVSQITNLQNMASFVTNDLGISNTNEFTRQMTKQGVSLSLIGLLDQKKARKPVLQKQKTLVKQKTIVKPEVLAANFGADGVMQETFSDTVSYLCYGDIIMLNYTKKIYSSDILDQQSTDFETPWDGESVDEAQQILMDDQERKAQQVLQKLIEPAQYVYKGIAYSDGILDKNVKIIPKQSEENTINAKCQFKKCLFRVEIFDNCTYHMLYKKQVDHLAQLKVQKEVIIETNNFQKISDMEHKIEKEEEKLKELRDEMKLEDASNKEVQDDHYGQNIQFGDRVLLRHVFTDLFLVIEPNLITGGEGKVQMNLSELSKKAILSFIPAQDIKDIVSELVIHGGSLSKFNLQVGGQINLQDSFFLLNREIGANYYAHVDSKAAAGKNGQFAELGFAGGLQPTHLRAKLFMSAAENIFEKMESTNADSSATKAKHSQLIFSGDTIRLRNQETQSCLQTQTGQAGKRFIVNPFPTFLQKQIKRLEEIPEDYEITREAQGLFDKDLDDVIVTDEDEQTGQTLIGMDMDPGWQSITNSCWEIQQVKSLKGGVVVLNGVYRFKHVATEKYLSIDPEGKVNIVLKSRSPTLLADTLFLLRSVNQEQELDDEDDEIEGIEIYHGTKFYLESAFNSFLQVYQKIEDDAEHLFNYKDKTKNDFYSQLKSNSMIQVVAGAKQLTCEEGEPKMVFEIELVPKEESQMAFKSLGFTTAIKNFYNFLNNWGVGNAEENVSHIDTLAFKNEEAIKGEEQLSEQVSFLSKSLADVKEILLTAMGVSKKKFKQMQKQLEEHFFVELLSFTLELIYYKTMPEEFREKAFKPDRLRASLGLDFQLASDHHVCYQIAREKLDGLNSEIIEIVFLMIRDNEENSERLTQFIDIFKNQFLREDKNFVLKLICHMYKMANFIFKDRASILLSENGVNQQLPNQFTENSQIFQWMNLLETVSYRNKHAENISNQIIYIKVITAIMKNKNFYDPMLHQQVQVLNRLIFNQIRTPVWFGYNRQANKLKRPFVYFARLQQENVEKFLQINPHLNQCASQGQTLDGQKKFDIIIDLAEMTQVCELDPENFTPYFRYIKAVVGMYEQLCTGRNRLGVKALRDSLGISNNNILTICESEAKEQLKIHQEVKDCFLNLSRTLIYNYLPFNKWITEKNPDNRVMCYFMDRISEGKPHHTVYSWEKFKYGEERGAGNGISEEECLATNNKLHQILIDFLAEPTMKISEYLYGSEGKKYTPENINPILQQIINRFKLIYAVVKAECGDAYFIQKVIDVITQVLAGFSYTKVVVTMADFWVYKLVRVSSKIEGSAYKLSKLIHLALRILRQICETRLSQQALQFMKIFKEFSQELDISYVGFDPTLLEPKFKRIFAMTQFNPIIEVQNLTKMLLMMDPKLPIFDDVQREKYFFSKQRESLKEIAIKTQEARKQIKVKEKFIDLENMDYEDLPTGQPLAGESARASVLSPAKAGYSPMNVEMAKLTSSKSELLMNNDTVADQDSPRQMEAHGYTPYKAPPDSEAENALWRNQLPLEEFLLYYAFIAEANDDIRLTAMSVINQNMNQRGHLMQLLRQVQVIVSDDDIELYNKLRFYKDRMEALIENLVINEFTFLIYKVGQKEKQDTNLRDFKAVSRRLMNLLKESHGLRLHRIQALLRQINLDTLLIDGFMKNIYYSFVEHHTTFQSILDLLFYFCLNNTVNQLSMKKHVSYLVYVCTHMGLSSGTLLGQLVSPERLSPYGQKFAQFIVRKIVEFNTQKYQLYKLLTFLVQNTMNLKILVLSQLIQSPVFRHKLYMAKKNVSKKVERVKELNRKILVLQSHQTNILTRSSIDPSIRDDYENIRLHISIVEIFSMCSTDNSYGIKQIRNIVDLDSLLDSILAKAVPFKLKKSYFRLLFTGYIQEVDEVLMFDINFPKFLTLLRHIVLNDIESYYMYYGGLAVTIPEEDERDEHIEGEKIEMVERIKVDLDRLSEQTFEQKNTSKNYKQKLEEKEFMLGLSPLNQNRMFPLIDTKDKNEYWEYFCSYDVELRRNDGLVYFVRDFYRAISYKLDEWSDELIDITFTLRETLLIIIDKIDRLKESYLESLIDMDNVSFALDECILAIPDLTSRLANKNRDIPQDEEQEEEQEEFGPDVEDKILRICRDNIIHTNASIREVFKIESKASDILVNPYYIKKKMKDVCGVDIPYREIAWFINKTMKQMLKKLQLKGVLGQEMGMEGYIRSRYQTMMLQDGISVKNSDLMKMLFNFKELETLIKSALIKAGYKTAMLEREDAFEDEQLTQMEGSQLSIGLQSDLQHFTKLYQEFMIKYDEADQIRDLATKILRRFNKVYLDAIRQLGVTEDRESAEALGKMYEYRYLKTQLMRMVIYLGPSQGIPHQIENKKCMLRLLCAMVKSVDPQKVEIQVRKVAQQRRTILQNLMTSVGILFMALTSVNSNEPSEIVDLSLEIIDLLCLGNNYFTLENLRNRLTQQIYGFSYFKMIEQKIIYTSSEIIKQGWTGSQDSPPVDQEGNLFNDEKENRKKEQTVQDVLINNFEEPFLQRNNQLQQPIFYPQVFSLEDYDLQSKTVQAEVLIPLLHMLQRQINSDCGFEQILIKQAAKNRKNVNLTKTIAYAFIDIIRSLQHLIFTQFVLIDVIQEILLTLTMLLESDSSTELKIQFAQWDLLLGQINWILELDFGFFNADKVETRFKIRLLQMVTHFLMRLMTHPNPKIQQEIASLIVKFLNKQNLRNKLIDIFKSRIGGTPHREKIFKTRAFCNHTKPGICKTRRNYCQKNEHCFYEHLIPMDQITIHIAEDLFQIIHILNTNLPKYKLDEIKFDHSVTGFYFNQNLKEMLPKLQFEAFNSISDQFTREQKTIDETYKSKTLSGEEQKGMEDSEVNQIMQQLYMSYAVHKYIDSVKRSRGEIINVRTEQHNEQFDKFIDRGIDQQKRLILQQIKDVGDSDPFADATDERNVFFVEELDNLEWDEVFLDLLNETQGRSILSQLKAVCCLKPSADARLGSKILRCVFCLSWAARCRRKSSMTPKEKALLLITMRRYFTKKSDLEKVTQYFSKREQQIQKKRNFIGPFFGNYTKQILQSQVYVYDQFKFEYAYQSMLETVSKVQIKLENGSLVTETFIIPHYARFLTQGTKDGIKKKTKYELLEKLAVIRVEMRSLQAMERFSPFVLWLVSKYTWSLQLSYWLTFVQNGILLMTYTRDKLLTPFTKDMIVGRVDLIQNEGDTYIDYSLELLSMLNMQSLFFSLWSYQILYFSVLEFNMVSQQHTSWWSGLCKRKEKPKKTMTGSFYEMYIDEKRAKDDPTEDFNDKHSLHHLVQDDETMEGAKTLLRRTSEIPSMQSPPGSPSRLGFVLVRIFKKISVLLRAPFHDSFQLQLLIFLVVSFFAIWLDWWNLTIMLLHLFMRVPFLNALLQVLKQSFRQVIRLVFLGFIMLYALSYVRLLSAFQFKTEQPDGTYKRDLHSGARTYGDESFFPEKTHTASTLLEAMQQVIGVEFHKNSDNTFTVLNTQVPGSLIQGSAQTITVAFFFLFVGIFIGTILGGTIGKGDTKLEDIKCPVCDVSRANYEAKKLTQKDWDNHMNIEHNIEAYIYYMLLCCDGDVKEKKRMTRTQKYVRTKLQQKDLSFIPIYNAADD